MSIARLTATFAFSLLAVQLASGVAAADCADPNRNPKTHKLDFKVKSNGCVEKVKDKDGNDAPETNVCEKDTVEWKVTGSGNEKMIAFVAETPFKWAASGFQGSRIAGEVLSGTKGKTFKYSVYVKDTVCILDPTIIVDR
jgi:hypothetical protein